MSWAIGYDAARNRDIGYGVPATCDHPGCREEIDRGLDYACGASLVLPIKRGCGLFFCAAHRNHDDLCERCQHGAEPFEPTPDLPIWIQHKLTHDSWQRWRDENAEEVAELRGAEGEANA